MSPKQCRVPASVATTVKMKQVESKGGPKRHRHRDEKMNTEARGREEHSRCMGGEGRKADRGEGVWKDKERGETFAGFKGCRLAWPWRSHEVYGCAVCWSCGIRWLFQVTLCSWLIWSSHRLFSRNAEKSRVGRGWLGPFSLLFDQKHVQTPSITQADGENRLSNTEHVLSETVHEH